MPVKPGLVGESDTWQVALIVEFQTDILRYIDRLIELIDIDRYRQIQIDIDRYRQIQIDIDRYRQIQIDIDRYR